MTPKEELKKLIASMSDEQIKQFIAQMQHVLFEESACKCREMQNIKGDQMAYYKTCPECGAALDPGEICDCRNEQRSNKGQISVEARTKQGEIPICEARVKRGRSTGETQKIEKNTAPEATNNRSGEVEQASRKLIYSALILLNDTEGCQA